MVVVGVVVVTRTMMSDCAAHSWSESAKQCVSKSGSGMGRFVVRLRMWSVSSNGRHRSAAGSWYGSGSSTRNNPRARDSEEERAEE